MLQVVAVKAAAGILAAGAIGGGVVVETSSGCPAGKEMTVFGCATVQNYPGETSSTGTNVRSSVTPSGGVDFRDKNGNRTGSGMSNQDQFVWLGSKKPGKNGDGMLIEVEQVTHGKGGWGPLYKGWIPVKFTQAPQMFG
jgi:hypothetical protein